LAELHSVLVRKVGCSPLEASNRLLSWTDRAIIVDTNAEVFNAALDLASEHGVPIFDAVVMAAAVEARCDLLLSEDFHDGFAWRGVVVTNPFRPAPDRRLARLLAD
jgi:predicted nucleic acid-binding protein